jgi:hypothetical protein
MLVLETTIRKEEKVTKTIPMPYYCREHTEFSPWLYKVVDGDNVIRVCNINGSAHLAMCSLDKKTIAEATEITEYEFEQALNQALDTIKAAALNTEVV